MKQWTLTEVLFEMDWYHDEVKEIFIGHPTLNVLEMIEISNKFSVEDGRQPLVLSLADALMEPRQQYIVCSQMIDRYSYILDEINHYPDVVSQHMVHAWNVLNCSNSPSIYVISEDVAVAASCLGNRYESDEYWDVFEEETARHIELIKEVLQ